MTLVPVRTGPGRTPRWLWAALALGLLPDLSAALIGTNHALYYFMMVLLVPLAALRLWITIHAAIRAAGRALITPPSRVWAAELIHSLLVIACLHWLQWNLVIHAVAPTSEAAHALNPIDRDLATWLIVVIWPYTIALLSAVMLLREWRPRSSRATHTEAVAG